MKARGTRTKLSVKWLPSHLNKPPSSAPYSRRKDQFVTSLYLTPPSILCCVLQTFCRSEFSTSRITMAMLFRNPPYGRKRPGTAMSSRCRPRRNSIADWLLASEKNKNPEADVWTSIGNRKTGRPLTREQYANLVKTGPIWPGSIRNDTAPTRCGGPSPRSSITKHRTLRPPTSAREQEHRFNGTLSGCGSAQSARSRQAN
ncbi:MAG: hypothetical protein OJF50_000732 [Nitrospira sp.]|nr:hypothetical protein [Nitrospira sp.]